MIDSNTQELANFERDSNIFAILFLVTLLTPIPLAHFFGWWGLALFGFIAIVTFYFAFRVEKHKKRFNIQTYKEITAFMEGTSLDEIERAREEGKRPYQKVFLAIASGILALVVAVVMTQIFRNL